MHLIRLFRSSITIFSLRFRSQTDVYFLSNVKTVDDLTAARKVRLLRTTNWSQPMVQSLETWPCFSVLTELGMMNTNQIFCAGCRQRGIASRMILYGQAYNPNTIEAMQPDNRITYEKVTRNKICSNSIIWTNDFCFLNSAGFTTLPAVHATLWIVS